MQQLGEYPPPSLQKQVLLLLEMSCDFLIAKQRQEKTDQEVMIVMATVVMVMSSLEGGTERLDDASALDSVVEEAVVVWPVLGRDCLDHLLAQHTTNNGTHWTQLRETVPTERGKKMIKTDWLIWCTLRQMKRLSILLHLNG